jgi:putative flippase GtrA
MSALRGDIVKFGVVGTIGFLIDSLILSYLVSARAWDPLLARIVSMSVAVLGTWLLHRYWTFAKGSARAPLPQTFVYGVVQLIGLTINYLVFSALVLSGGVWRAYPVLPIAAGSLAAMTLTYVLARTVVFAEPGQISRAGRHLLGSRRAKPLADHRESGL